MSSQINLNETLLQVMTRGEEKCCAATGVLHSSRPNPISTPSPSPLFLRGKGEGEEEGVRGRNGIGTRCVQREAGGALPPRGGQTYFPVKYTRRLGTAADAPNRTALDHAVSLIAWMHKSKSKLNALHHIFETGGRGFESLLCLQLLERFLQKRRWNQTPGFHYQTLHS